MTGSDVGFETSESTPSGTLPPTGEPVEAACHLHHHTQHLKKKIYAEWARYANVSAAAMKPRREAPGHRSGKEFFGHDSRKHKIQKQKLASGITSNYKVSEQ